MAIVQEKAIITFIILFLNSSTVLVSPLLDLPNTTWSYRDCPTTLVKRLWSMYPLGTPCTDRGTSSTLTSHHPEPSPTAFF